MVKIKSNTDSYIYWYINYRIQMIKVTVDEMYYHLNII